MTLAALVSSHRNHGLADIQRISARSELVAPQVASRPDLVAGCVVLATCNRFEVYLDLAQDVPDTPQDREEAVRYVRDVIATASGTDFAFTERTLDLLDPDAAIRHLFSVSASLDSMAVGEKEIIGQVRKSLSTAQFQRTTSPVLDLAFQHAFRVGKAISNQTGLGTTGRSLVDVALDLALTTCASHSSVLPSWRNASSLIIGTGAYAGATVSSLQRAGCREISVYSHSGRAREFARTHPVEAVDVHSVTEAMSGAHVVVACSGTGPSLTAAAVREALELRASRSPLVLIDMALRHDIDPAVADVPGAYLITLETIQHSVPEEHTEALDLARRMVEDAAAEFAIALTTRDLDHAVVAVRQRAQRLLDRELEKLPAEPTRADMERALRRLTNTLLHTPTLRARELAAQGREADYIEGVAAVYGIDVRASAESS